MSKKFTYLNYIMARLEQDGVCKDPTQKHQIKAFIVQLLNQTDHVDDIVPLFPLFWPNTEACIVNAKLKEFAENHPTYKLIKRLYVLLN